MPKPTKKANVLHQQLLAGLIETRATSWTRKRVDPDSPNPRKPNIIETKVVGSELRYPLARNVSEFNVERAAKRWIP
ncbi:hypothetical protein KIP30_gp32 [Mycobacterium phage Pistachio]|uniref:Uncharacterized protein n=1 Tax=Mycobacterium phage Pistachio TaxID=2126722 RepID=A0A2R4A2D7_9CAUD|nr:hypothetical protein KIP30_gp32 [Mycobacterium phage Pistachio]AQT28464.1 hypothetical protein SEA_IDLEANDCOVERT_65 [Mycobacterium phage Idleandcovert]AVR57048.1 hypothetical protein PBI_PUPPY_65 [Mycobacterium phage Puppy]AVR77476.1 hypothetical protein SEA_TNGUYEN7_66 [Mycobacterium phage TNguyen7]WAB10251.1 hypothetical protein PBI_BLUEBIRD_67 [Mycobacterium phage BlueBird]AVR57137.1 hypothetical protein PBI_PISTACHIO_65 [Mycobacterium phage Pistachio]